MHIADVIVTERACAEYRDYSGKDGMTVHRLQERLRDATASGDGVVTEWRGERVIIVEGTYWTFDYDRAGGRLTLTGCAAIVMMVGFSGVRLPSLAGVVR